jgi:hypothetical protein
MRHAIAHGVGSYKYRHALRPIADMLPMQLQFFKPTF